MWHKQPQSQTLLLLQSETWVGWLVVSCYREQLFFFWKSLGKNQIYELYFSCKCPHVEWFFHPITEESTQLFMFWHVHQAFECHKAVCQEISPWHEPPRSDRYSFYPTAQRRYQHSPVALGCGHPSDACVYVCVYVPAGFPATAYGPVAAAAVAAVRGSGRGARGRGGYLAYPQSTGPGKRSVHVLCGCCSLQLLLLCFSP